MLHEFKFLFPIQDTRIKRKSVHFTDLHVTAYCGLSTKKEITEIKNGEIKYYGKGEPFGANISDILHILAPELFDRIARATEQHALKKFSPKREIAI